MSIIQSQKPLALACFIITLTHAGLCWQGKNMPPPAPPHTYILRFLQINDVYELENLPRFATAVKETKAAALKEEEERGVSIRVVAVVAGDFIAPSLLSCLDEGRGMIDVLNACGVDYVCFGNHETDVPHKAMLERIAESNFPWINSSMPSLPLLDVPLDAATKLPPYVLFELGGGPKVALLGLLTDDPGLYRPNSFGGAPILPLPPTATRLRQQLYEEEGVDCVLALTHQAIALDRALARTCLFPLILGGHDHDPYQEKYGKEEGKGIKESSSSSSLTPPSEGKEQEAEGEEGLSESCLLVKVGMDAKLFGFVDVEWVVGGGEEEEERGRGEMMMKHRSPRVTGTTKEASYFPPDPAVSERVTIHLRVLEELEQAAVCPIPKGHPLSSKGIRKMQTSMGTMLVTAARKALQTDCAFVNAGNIRGNTAYPLDKENITYKDLKAEVPFLCGLVIVHATGEVLSSLLQFSRRFSLLDPPVEKGGYLQVDDGVLTDPSTHAITHIAQQPLEPEKLYTLATTWGVITGIDDLKPILEWKAMHPSYFPPVDTARGFKEVLVTYYSRALWWDLAKRVGFQEMDANGDGVLSMDEVEKATEACYGEALSQLVLRNLMATADHNGDGVVSKHEFLRICLSHEAAFHEADQDEDGVLSFDELWTLLKAHFDGKSGGSRSPIRGGGHKQQHGTAGAGTFLTHEEVRKVYEELDKDGQGGITWAEFQEHLGGQWEPTAIVI